MKISVGTDHAGFELKEYILNILRNAGHEVVDRGAFKMESLDDYPDFIRPVAVDVSNGEVEFGIIFGGSGQGEAMVANRIKGVRAAVYNSENIELINLTREHNDANILSIGARFISKENATEAVLRFIDKKFSDDERHLRRINKIDSKTL